MEGEVTRMLQSETSTYSTRVIILAFREQAKQVL